MYSIVRQKVDVRHIGAAKLLKRCLSKTEHRNVRPHTEVRFDTTTWVVWANTENDAVLVLFLFFIFFATHTGCTASQIWTSEDSKCVVPRKDVPFGGLNYSCPKFLGQTRKS